MRRKYFMDSSALVKFFITEKGSESVICLVDEENIVISRLTQVEVVSAIARWSRTQSPAPDIESLIQAFQCYVTDRFEVVEINEYPVLNMAMRLAVVHRLRAADSIQLACALIARQNTGSNPFTLVSCDHELNAAAQIEGLTIENPDSLEQR